jgi:hypothetical protein
MSAPREPEPVKLIASIFSPEKALIEKIFDELSKQFGTIDIVSDEFAFDRTRYYEKEMGWPLYRNFVSFEELVSADQLVAVKLVTNRVEQKYTYNKKRKANIDPGFLSHERVILATGKNYIHRVYLSKGIYADLTLLYKKGGYRHLEWTYPDYRNKEVIEFFNRVRETYTKQIKEGKRLG